MVRPVGALSMVMAVVLVLPWAGCEDSGVWCCDCECCDRQARVEREGQSWVDCNDPCAVFCERDLACSQPVDSAVECGSAPADAGSGGAATGPGLHPQDGEWTGTGIRFSVSGGGTWVAVGFADYGSCAHEECSTAGTADCSSCGTSITSLPDEATFADETVGCSGTFDSETSASGTCSQYDPQCLCTMSQAWTASP